MRRPFHAHNPVRGGSGDPNDYPEQETTEQAPPPAGQDWQYILPASSTQVPQLLPSGCGAQVQLSAKAAVLAKESAATATAKLKLLNFT